MKITLGALGKKVTLISTAFILAASSLTALGPFVLSQRVGAVSGTYTDIDTAITATPAGGVVNLTGNITVDRQITINKSLTINGNGYVIYGPFAKTSNSNNSIISIHGESNTVALNNLTVDGTGGTDLHGINVYISNAVLNNVTIKNNRNTAINVNGSHVTVNELATSGHRASVASFGVIDVNKGSGVTREPSLVLNGPINHAEPVSGTSAHIRQTLSGALRVTDNTGSYVRASQFYLSPFVNGFKWNYVANPVVNGENFNTHSGSDYQGINVGFNIADFGTVSSVSVSLYQDDTLLATNTGNAALLALANGGTTQLSTPFITNEGTYVEEYWELGVHTMTPVTKPTRAIVTVVGTNGTRQATLAPLTEPNNWPYENLFSVERPIHESPSDAAFINNNDFWFEWSDVDGAVSYELQNSTNPAVNPDGSFSNVMWTGDYQQVQPTESRARSVGANGTWYWQVRAVDAYGNKSEWTAPWKMAIDMSTPVVPSATYTATPSGTAKTSGGYTNEKDFKFTLSSSADIVRYQLKYWNDIPGSPFKEASPWNPANLSGYQAGQGLNAYVDQFTQGEGKHYFAFSACDAAGNCSAYSTPFVITYDKTIPDTAITGATVLGNTLSFEGSVSDLHLNYYYCYLTTNQTIVVDGHTFTPGQEVRLNGNADSSRNGACNTTWASGATSFTGVVGGFTIPGVPDGDYTINLVARDLAGNNNAGSPAQYVLTLDRTAPNVTVNPIADSTNTTPTITGTVDADAVSVKVSLDEGVTWHDAVIDGTTWTFAVTSPLAVRTHTVIAIATDAVGNTSSSDILTPQPYWTQFAVNALPVIEEETTTQQDSTTTQTGTPVPAATIVAPQDTTPDAEVETEDDADGNVSAAGESDSNSEASTLGEQDSQKSWSLVNALLSAGIVLGSIVALVGAFGKKQDKDAKSKRVVGLITLIPAIGAAILFFAVEDLSAKMVWLNTWTILVTIIAVLQVALVAKARDNE